MSMIIKLSKSLIGLAKWNRYAIGLFDLTFNINLQVEEINFGTNSLLTISHTLSQLKKLTKLDLSDNKITEIPSTLALLQNSLVFLILKGQSIFRSHIIVAFFTHYSGNPLLNNEEASMPTKQLLTLLMERQKLKKSFEQYVFIPAIIFCN